MSLKSLIRDVPNFPKTGITFKDITPLLKNPNAFEDAVEQMCQHWDDGEVQTVVAVESRGFIFGAAIAALLGAGFVPVRKKGKLPFKTQSVEFTLEYGNETLEIHTDALEEKESVIIVDDVLATGGTIDACLSLLSQSRVYVAGITTLIELEFLNGRKAISDKYTVPIHSVLNYKTPVE